jgi:hypothetical protein
MSWLSVAIRGIAWGTVLRHAVTLGLPYLYGLIRRKSPTVAQIVEAIVEAILAERPDLLNSPVLIDKIRMGIKEAGLPRALERDALSYAMRTYDKSS